MAFVIGLAPKSAWAQTTAAEVESPPAQQAQADDQARGHFDAGQAHYERGDYAAAVQAFSEALRISKKPELLYNLAQAERLNGDCAAALQHYREFQTAARDAPADLSEKIAEMERCVADAAKLDAGKEKSAPAAAALPPPPPPRPAPTDSTIQPEESSTYRVLGWASLGGAALSAALGTVFALKANAASNELTEVNRRGAQWSGHYQASEDSMIRDRNLAIGLFIGAGVLAGTGGWLLLAPPTGSHGNGTAVRVGGRF
jgi:tetratricopeptide (TPR) repeat protein